MGDLYRGCRSANCLQSNQTKPFTHIFLECLPYLNWEDFEVFLGGIYMYLGCQSMARLQSNKTKPFKPFTSLKRIGKTSRCFYGGFYLGCRCVARLESNQGAADEPSLTSLGNLFPARIPRIQRTILRQTSFDIPCYS